MSKNYNQKTRSDSRQVLQICRVIPHRIRYLSSGYAAVTIPCRDPPCEMRITVRPDAITENKFSGYRNIILGKPNRMRCVYITNQNNSRHPVKYVKMSNKQIADIRFEYLLNQYNQRRKSI